MITIAAINGHGELQLAAPAPYIEIDLTAFVSGQPSLEAT